MLSVLAVVLGLGAGCRSGTVPFPGTIYLLANATVYEIAGGSAAAIRTGVQTAALSPDGQILLVADEGGTRFLNFATGEEKKIADLPARSLGWNGEGSRFFLLTDPASNQLLVGDRVGKTRLIYRGARRLAPAGTAEGVVPEPGESIAGEISGCLFLDPTTLVFSAFEGVLTPSADAGADRAYLVDVAAEELDLRFQRFPADERWRFVDVDSESGFVLAVIEKKPTGAFRPFLASRFETWEELSWEPPLPGTIIRSANGDYSLGFQPTTGWIGGISVLQDKRGYRGQWFFYDPATLQAQAGPDLGWGDNIARPAFHPDGGWAALLIYTWSKDWRLKIVDLAGFTVSTAWTLRAPGGETASPNDRILAWMR
jgi:hypothetical protein